MKYIWGLFVTLILLSCGIHHNNTTIVKEYDVQAIDAVSGIDIGIDSIMYRNDVTRLYGKLVGKPHTSWRIDSMKINGQEILDIDGVDLRRWFQWEDEGEIAVELDCQPSDAALTKFQINTFGPKGDISWTVTKK